MFAVVNKSKVVAVTCVIVAVMLVVTVYLCLSNVYNATAVIGYTVVLDAGHGGIDGGVVGVDGITEAPLNLQYAKALGKVFGNCGFNVVYTRTDNNGLYGLPTTGFKRRDMLQRKKIITQHNANMVISLHMNKFSASYRSGPQVFYQKGDEESKALADSIQQALNNFTGNTHSALSGDYYICREVPCPSVVVECGFISNSSEAHLLVTEEYTNQLTDVIFQGVMLYLYA